mgnify:CR=1 FL=1
MLFRSSGSPRREIVRRASEPVDQALDESSGTVTDVWCAARGRERRTRRSVVHSGSPRREIVRRASEPVDQALDESSGTVTDVWCITDFSAMHVFKFPLFIWVGFTTRQSEFAKRSRR